MTLEGSRAGAEIQDQTHSKSAGNQVIIKKILEKNGWNAKVRSGATEYGL